MNPAKKVAHRAARFVSGRSNLCQVRVERNVCVPLLSHGVRLTSLTRLAGPRRGLSSQLAATSSAYAPWISSLSGKSMRRVKLYTASFYGHGLGWFGHAERWQQVLVVFGVSTVNIVLSSLWLARCHYGPLEWLWRSLTYLRLQPMAR